VLAREPLLDLANQISIGQPAEEARALEVGAIGPVDQDQFKSGHGIPPYVPPVPAKPRKPLQEAAKFLSGPTFKRLRGLGPDPEGASESVPLEALEPETNRLALAIREAGLLEQEA